MARIRTIKPEFFDDEDLCALSPLHRLCFVGLWTQADKAGRFEDRPKRLKARIFPFDDVDMDAMLSDLARAAFIIRYAVDGKHYGCIKPSGWKKHQRPRNDEPESVLPPVDSESVSTDSDDFVTVESLGKERKGREGKGELRERFDRFWDVYPKKVGKDAAWVEFQKRNPGDDLTSQMIAVVQAQRASEQWRKDGGQYIPHPRTWLHQGRWQDEQPRSRPPLELLNDAGEDWFTECQRLHAGACGGRVAHDTRMYIDQQRASA